MIFTTPWYVVFALISTALYWVIPKGLARQLYLAIACGWFHFHFAGPAGVLPIVVMMALTFGAGVSGNRTAQGAAIVANVAALVFYKYINFIGGVLIAPLSPGLAKAFEGHVHPLLPAAPPLAVSFFTFEFVHYLYELRHGGNPIRNPVKFVLFSLFFPSLVAGPIKRYTQFIPEMEEATQRNPRWDDFSEGLRRISIGFVKKVILADSLTAWIDEKHASLGTETTGVRWLFLLALGFRILFDFSGYTDIAIGSARLIGIRLPENFNWPYLASSLQGFWQRWHMSLSSWIRDYVYIPLGGNRCGLPRQILNAALAFSLCGLWHGPALNFVVWGLYHGLGLGLVVSYKRIPLVGPALQGIFSRVPPLGFLLTQAYVFLGWILFFYPLGEAWRLAKLILGVA